MVAQMVKKTVLYHASFFYRLVVAHLSPEVFHQFYLHLYQVQFLRGILFQFDYIYFNASVPQPFLIRGTS
jgi:hypothetical protein